MGNVIDPKQEVAHIKEELIAFSEGQVVFIVPDYTHLLSEPFFTNTIKGKILKKIVAIWMNIYLQVFGQTLKFKKSYDQKITDSLSAILNDIHSEGNQSRALIKKMLDEKVYETQKLVDGFKSEVLVEVNRGSNEGTRTPIKTKIINEQKVKSSNPLKINVGAGRDIRNDYINIDNRELHGIDIVADVNELPFEKDTVDEVYAAHLIEHFTEYQLKKLITIWFGLLKKGGELVLITPNLEIMVKDYVGGKIDWNNLRRIILGGQDYVGDYHYNAFSPDYLTGFIQKTLPGATFNFTTKDRVNGECKELELRIHKT